MDGLGAYRFYQALKLHFESDSFDVFKAQGRVKCSRARFEKRNDRYLFEKLANKYDQREYVKYISANMMYGNFNVIYNGEGDDYYKIYEKRKQAITKVFLDDIQTLEESGSGLLYENILQSLISDKITMETAVILNNYNHEAITQPLMESNYGVIFEDVIRRISKSSRFVIYQKEKLGKVCAKYLGE